MCIRDRSRTVSIDEMADAINEGLKEYATLASTQVKSAVRKSAKTVKDQICLLYTSQGQMWRRGCAGKEKHMEERMMDTIVEIYNHMDDSDKDAFTLEDAEDMVEDQIRMDKEAGRESLAYDPQFFYDTIVELMEQDEE